MADRVLDAAIQQQLMKLMETVSRELRSISDTLDAIVAVIEGGSDG